jgi:ABC-type lipoprotein release transport system permease subunit
MIFKVAFRNILRQKRRTFLTMLTMTGGFILSALFIGWSDGSYNNIIEIFTRNQLGHIQIHADGYLNRPSLYKNINNYDEIGGQLSTVEEIDAWTPRLYASGLVSIDEKTSGARIIGIDPVRENDATNFNNKIIKGKEFSRKASGDAILGKGLANILKAELNDEIVIFSQAADGSIANDLYIVIGIAESSDEMSDRTSLYLHLDDAQELFVLGGRIHELVIIANDLDNVTELTQMLRNQIENTNLEILPWQEFAKAFYEAMRSDQQGTWIMIGIIIFIVAAGVLNTVLMNVLERQREYGVLRAIGMRPRQVFRLVTTEVIIMSALSVVIGIAISIPINYYLSINGISLPYEFTYGGMLFTHTYTEVNLHSLYIPGLAVIISAIFVSVFPSIKAARIAPARAMRIH